MANVSAMKDPTGYLSPDDIDRMIKAEPEFRNQLIIRLLFRGGMRVSELCKARKTDILWKEGCLVIPWLKRRTPEGQDPPRRKIPLDPNTMILLRQWIDYRKKFHVRPEDTRIIALDRRRVYWIVRRAAERVGISKVGDPHKPHHPHPHVLRHSYATFRVEKTGGDYAKLRKVQLDMGHANINTTASYLAVNDKELHREYDEAWEGMD